MCITMNSKCIAVFRDFPSSGAPMYLHKAALHERSLCEIQSLRTVDEQQTSGYLWYYFGIARSQKM